MIDKITELDGSFHYKDEAGNLYCRVLLGLSFPASNPGFAVVLAEDYYEDPTLKCRHLRALAETEESDTGRLFRQCLDLRERYWVEKIIADRTNEPMTALLRDFNKGLDGARPLYLYEAAFPDDLRYQVSLISGVTQFNHKILHLDQCERLRGHLSGLTLEEVSQGKGGDHPAVLALGYVLAYVKSHPRDPVRDRIRPIPKEEEYDPLTFGLGRGI
jgi:hypothetical protein